MYWSEDEIARKYKESGEKTSQIRVIAELNGCSTEEIKAVLRDKGFNIKSAKKNEQTPAIVIKTLKEKSDAIVAKLCEIADTQKNLRKQEEELTKQYADIRDYMKKIAADFEQQKKNRGEK